MDNGVSKCIFEFSESNNGYSFEYTIESSLALASKDLKDIDLKLEETSQSINCLTPDCDKTDYALAVSSGVLCGLIDVFLVAKPGDTPLGDITDKWFADKTEHFAKLCGWNGKGKDSFHSAVKFLEDKFNVPYDQPNSGEALKEILKLSTFNHHFKSLAHNASLLGLFFSVLDQFANTSHFISGGELIILDDKGKFELIGTTIPQKLYCAFVNWIGHIISDASGSSHSKGRGMGIPSPLWTWMNDITAIKAGLNLKTTEFEKDFNDFAVKLYTNGYDIRFQSTQTIPVLINEMLVRLLYSLRRLFKFYSVTPTKDRNFINLWDNCEPFKNATVKRMLTVAHGTFCLLDVGDAVVRGFASGGGYFNIMEFIMRLNLPGIGRFGVTIMGEANRGFKINRLNRDKRLLEREKLLIVDHVQGLKRLAEYYDDKELLRFINDYTNSKAYEEAFAKSIELAKKRGVPEERILKSKSEIDSYFSGRNMNDDK